MYTYILPAALLAKQIFIILDINKFKNAYKLIVEHVKLISTAFLGRTDSVFPAKLEITFTCVLQIL